MNASGRRQRQASNGFAHLAPRQRPNYKQTDAAASARRLAATIAEERAREHRRGLSNKSKKQHGAVTTRFAFVALIAIAIYAVATYELITTRCAASHFQPAAEQHQLADEGQTWAFVDVKGGRKGGKKH